MDINEGFDFDSLEPDDENDTSDCRRLPSDVMLRFLRDAAQLRQDLLASGILEPVVDAICWILGYSVHGKPWEHTSLDWPFTNSEAWELHHMLVPSNLGFNGTQYDLYVNITWDARDGVKFENCQRPCELMSDMLNAAKCECGRWISMFDKLDYDFAKTAQYLYNDEDVTVSGNGYNIHADGHWSISMNLESAHSKYPQILYMLEQLAEFMTHTPTYLKIAEHIAAHVEVFRRQPDIAHLAKIMENVRDRLPEIRAQIDEELG